MQLMPECEAFTCRRCGHCCQGEGGILLDARDIERLGQYLHLDRETLLGRYATLKGPLPRLVSGEDGYCIFYHDGCGIHPARPDVCRAWPYFRGNIIDPDSHAMAMADCPGINPEVSHAEFARQGKAYLARHGLARAGGDGVPRALTVCIEEESGEKEHGRPDIDAA